MWLLPALIASAIAMIILVFVYFYLNYTERKKYFLLWSIAWILYFTRFILMIIDLQIGGNIVLSTLYFEMALISTIFLVYGTFNYIGKKIEIIYLVIGIVSIVWIIIANLLRLSFMVLTIPPFLFMGLVYIRTGVAFIKEKASSNFINQTLGIVFILWGVHKFDYPFVRNIEWFAPIGYILVQMFALIIAVGILVLYFQKSKALLVKSEKRLRAAESISHTGYYERNFKTGVIYFSDELWRILGYKPGETELSLDVIYSLYHKDEVERVRKILKKVIEEGFKADYEARIVTKTNEIIYARMTGSVSYDKEGNPDKLHATVMDINESKKREIELYNKTQRLIKAEKKLLTANSMLYQENQKYKEIESLLAETEKMGKVGSWIVDLDTNKQVWSKEVYNIHEVNFDFNNSVENGINFYAPTSRPIINQAVQNAIEKGETYNVELEIITAKGNSRWVNAIGKLDAEKHNLFGFFQDITERKLREKEKEQLIIKLNQQQRLESVGTLAGGVAHEINNPLNGIMNYAQLILDSIETDSENSTYAKEIISETNRIAVIVKNLLQFSRNDKQGHSNVNIKDIIENTLTLINTVIKHDQIDLQIDIPEDLPALKCRSQQIQQVIMNLVTNARDAINEKYEGYHEDKIIKLYCKQFNRENCKWIRVTVEDRGNGIPKAIQENIFEPFFTSKTRDEGTGLGLSISYGIVKDHHGELTFETKEGQYTKFYLDLPVDNDRNLEN